MKFLYPVFIIFLLFAGCTGKGKKDIHTFYYPIQELTKPMVYEYQPINNPKFPPIYGYFQTLKQDSGTFFVGQYYDPNFLPSQLFREKIVDNGALLQSMTLFRMDSTGRQWQVPVNIEHGNTFPFEVTDSNGVFLYSVNWVNPIDTSDHTYLIRNRRYLGDTTYVYQNKTYDCIRFGVKEIQDNDHNGHLEIEYSGMEIYAKNIGLVYFDRYTHDGLLAAYQLAGIYPMEALIKKFKEKTKQ